MKRVIIFIFLTIAFSPYASAKNMWPQKCREDVLKFCGGSDFRAAASRCGWMNGEKFGKKCQKYLSVFVQFHYARNRLFRTCQNNEVSNCFELSSDRFMRCIAEAKVQDGICSEARDEYLRDLFNYEDMLRYELGFSKPNIFD